MAFTIVSSRLRVKALLVTAVVGLLAPPRASADVHSYCGVEIGSKGVKARGIKFGLRDAEGSIERFYTRNINTTVVAGMQDGELQRSGIDETAAAVAMLLKEMKAKEPDCRPYVVGSSGVGAAKNRTALSDAVSQGVDLTMDFVTAAEEAELGFIASVPRRDWDSAVIIDIGSGNTKLGYRGPNGFRAGEVPYGTVTLKEKAAAAGGADFGKVIATTIDTSARLEIRKVSSGLPGIANKRKIFWVGGAAYCTATFMRPDQAARALVRLNPGDVKRFLGALRDKTWANYKPSEKASAKARKAFEHDSQDVLEHFTKDDLLSGVGLFAAFLDDRSVEGPIYFPRYGEWSLGYAARKYRDDIYEADAPEE